MRTKRTTAEEFLIDDGPCEICGRDPCLVHPPLKANPRAPHPERDAEIYAKRKAGKTQRALSAEYGLSREVIRRIEFKERQREENPHDYELSARAVNSIRNVLWGSGFDDFQGRSDYGFSNPETVAKQVAASGRDAFVGIGNCGRKTIAEIEGWINKYGCRWGPQVDLNASEYTVSEYRCEPDEPKP